MRCVKCGNEIDDALLVGPARCQCGQWMPWQPPSGPPMTVPGNPSEHWLKLHRFPIFATESEWSNAEQWYVDWQRTIPSLNCDCRTHWKGIVKRLPPDFSSREAFFAWSVEAHNQVNALLSKPKITLDEATNLYRRRSRMPGDPPSVGFLSASYMEIGGTETWNRTILPRLTKVHVEGMAVTAYGGGDPEPLGCNYGFGIDAARDLAANVDVLVAWGIANVKSLLPAVNPPKVVLVHHGDLNNQWFEWFVDSQRDVADAVVAINPTVVDYARSRVSCRVEYIPNAVAPERITATNQVEIDGRPIVVWCARFSTEKRVQLAIEAARFIPDWRFVIIGDGHDGPIDPPANVTLTGRLPNQADWLAVADVFLSTADQEGFGLSMAEAMLAGVPVVATPFGLGAHSDLVEQLPAHPTPARIADAIRAAAGDSEKAANARQYIEATHSPETIVRSWQDLITDLASQQSNEAASHIFATPEFASTRLAAVCLTANSMRAPQHSMMLQSRTQKG